MTSGFIPGDLPSNSHKSRSASAAPEPAPKVVEQIVSGKVTRRKVSLTKRMTALFIAGDPTSVLNHVAMEVALPKARELITDLVTEYVQKMIYGENYNGTRRSSAPMSRSGNPGYVSYNRFSARTPEREAPRAGALSIRDKETHNFDELVFETRMEADSVLDGLLNLIDQYNQATVADFYHLAGQTGSFADAKWGWTELSKAGIQSVREGYLLRLPAPQALER